MNTDDIKNRSSRKHRKEQPFDPAKRKTLKKLAAVGLVSMLDIGVFSSCGYRTRVSGSGRQRVIVLGIDGLDYRSVKRYLKAGKLPHLQRLANSGGFRPIMSSIPPQSPVAWANFITGRDPGGHTIYDFIQRDPETYLPYLSIARTQESERRLTFGNWQIPLSENKLELLRKGTAFWDYLTDKDIPARIYHAPSNFPPNDTGARQIAGLGAPDLCGTDGEFTYFTEAPFDNAEEVTGGVVHKVALYNNRLTGELKGPANGFRKGNPPPETKASFEVKVDREHKLAKISLQGNEIILKEREWSDWLPLKFEMIPHAKSVSGICRFYLQQVAPHFKLFVSPINIDPRDPALPITAPADFSKELAEQFGPFYTQGFPYDVKALRGGVLDEGEFLQQAEFATGESKRMYEAALQDNSRGLLFSYFSETDRIQHMFWRNSDPRHPAYDPKVAALYHAAIEKSYRYADDLVGLALQELDENTTLIVMSDHGFAPYYRSFHLNTWLANKGYLAGDSLRDAGADILEQADWATTTAYGLGFNALYLNMKDRESQGWVSEGDKDRLLNQLCAELESIRDPQTGGKVITKAYRTDQAYSALDPQKTPDIIVGYAAGYRCSDKSVLGEVTKGILEDNNDIWSGDHCIDCMQVPGVVFASKPIQTLVPSLQDVAVSALDEFAIPAQKGMTGKSIW